MSPKKRNRRKSHQGPAPRTAETEQGRTEPGRLTPGRVPEKRPLNRTPLTVTEPPDRRITVLWVILWCLWALGTPLALAALLFAGLDSMNTPADPTMTDPDLLAEQQDQNLKAIGNALVWFLVMAWAVPAAGATTALILRRTMAAIAFTTALALSVALTLWVMPPTELWAALSTHLFG
ncbi:hypothetical protein GCM10007079_19050 [Nocardiopsis terrae]|uniref:Uncharacterized protein n=1 Tax=Nocardiopsis terrae TaxID=372655 RepID=A0ABR9HI10_9ACTN|nr:hypothetical protein [Nocardiopsis terrae]MBE1458475.1 hypothetical protein [Nocardiopsis terrae]GHC80239.1 hypothetical protein GCM10007079_19050 [Nocardiopsis terrae]